MKQYIKDLIRKLYFRFCDPDIVAMTRKQLELFRMPLDLSVMTADEQDKFASRIKDLLKNDDLQTIINMVVNEIKENMVMKTQAQNIIYDRFSINGISLLTEKMQEVSQRVEEVDNEPFDPFAIVSDV